MRLTNSQRRNRDEALRLAGGDYSELRHSVVEARKYFNKNPTDLISIVEVIAYLKSKQTKWEME